MDAINENLVLWIDGQDGIRRLIDQAQWDIDRKIRNVKDELATFSTKNVKGKTYWYQWVTTRQTSGGRWKYMGTKDPRPKLTARIKQLEQMKGGVKKRFMEKVHCEMGKHLIVDPGKIKPQYGDAIKISEVIRKAARPSGPARITDKGVVECQ